jgi:type IV pilus assembly protein PilE
MPKKSSRSRGFSLIELAIVVVIIGILAAVAYPVYANQLIRSNRADAQQALMRMAQQAERFYTQQNSYGDDERLGAFLDAQIDEAQRSGMYVYTVSVDVDGRSYSITATPDSSGRNAADGVLEIRSDGSRTRGGSKSWSER